MTQEEALRRAFVSLEVNDDFSEAALQMRDGSRLCFRHRVDERWVRAQGAATNGDTNLTVAILATIARFRLNAKHLEIWFEDGGRWEASFPNNA